MTRYEYWLRTGRDRDTGEPTQNPPFSAATPSGGGQHASACSCMACDSARLRAMNSTHVINDWGDLHLGLGVRKQQESSRQARINEERRSDYERERERGGRRR